MANPYLEPIEEKDLNAEQKFKGGGALKKETEAVATPEESKEAPAKVESEKPQEISKAEKDDSYGKILSKVKAQPAVQPNEDDVKDDAKKAIEKTDPESQITNLVDLAMTKGVVHAVKVAQHMEDNYVLDMFHDKLMADELHDALVKKGLITEEK